MMFVSFDALLHPMTSRLLNLMYGKDWPLDILVDAITGDGWIVLSFDSVIDDGEISEKHFDDTDARRE